MALVEDDESLDLLRSASLDTLLVLAVVGFSTLVCWSEVLVVVVSVVVDAAADGVILLLVEVLALVVTVDVAALVVVLAVSALLLLLDVALLGVLGTGWLLLLLLTTTLDVDDDEKSFLENSESDEPLDDVLLLDEALLDSVTAGDCMLVWDRNDLVDVADDGDMISGVDALPWLIRASVLLDVAFVGTVVVVFSVTVLVLLLLLSDTLAQ